MKIKNRNVRISIINIFVVGMLALFLISYFVSTGDLSFFLLGIVLLVLMLLIPLMLNYMSQDQYAGLIPIYESEAKDTRIKNINSSMIGNIVRIEGVVERVLFKSLNRPQYLVADKSGEISVKMFTTPIEDADKDDVVEVYGQIIKRYIFVGDPVINAVIIRKLDRKSDQKK
ncbi:nucleotide-binding protein [Methanoplanus sp. FWC-SCC4]|uniref:Nucleotide-binding protein n=1 Tax=Methanochimaera problematica TaxID=2609417 RepID=A0AA97FBU8_9EURY|nr:nucleotide-binding protein [Methanoplanus sp. FWC-SCC4]WOF16207.1 nucleotide-binding protein [Methanoplanus sp. FWC-SCC4]